MQKRVKYMLIILLLLPLITMIVINLNRDKLENDRNFYGKECSVDQLKVTKNGYEKYIRTLSECNEYRRNNQRNKRKS